MTVPDAPTPGIRPVALITGATSGMGRVLAERLAETHEIHAWGRNREALAELDRIPGVQPREVDLLDLDFDGLLPERLDVLVHCAAIMTRRSVARATAAEWQRELLTDVVAPAELTRLAIPALRASRGTVVFVNSGAGQRAIGGHTVYCAAKFAERALADGLRQEEQEHGVRVVTVYPGPTDTPLLAGDFAELGRPYEPERYLRPETVVATILHAVRAPADTQLTDISVRPRREL